MSRATTEKEGRRRGSRTSVYGVVRAALRDFVDDSCPTLAGSLSYYTVFSLPPFLVVLMLLLGAVLDPADVRGALEAQIESLVGSSGGELARELLQQADQPFGGGLGAALLGGGALLLGATGAFIQLQAALNRVWEVEPDPAQGGVRNFVTKRAFAVLLVLGIAFFLLVSLSVSAAVSVIGDRASGLLPDGVSEILLHGLDLGLSFSVIALMFAAMLKFLPDAQIAWRDAWVGALVTALLFMIGKLLIGLYLGRSNPGQAYGAAASLAVLLVWIYYASMILLFGAEFTQSWAERRGGRVVPEPGAVEVREEEQRGRATPATT
jgi:membrane protein